MAIRGWWLLLLGCVACTSTPEDARRDTLHFGLVRSFAETNPDGGTIRDVSVIGVWADASPPGLGVGYRRRRELRVPLDCRLAVLVRTDAQLAAVRPLLATLAADGDRPCAYRF